MQGRFFRGTIFWGETLRMKGRFMRGTVLGRDASYEEALYERNRFVCPLVFGKLRTAFNAD